MKKSIVALIAIFSVSTISFASVQEDFNQAEHVNKEWQAQQMKNDIQDIKDNEDWKEIEKSNSSDDE